MRRVFWLPVALLIIGAGCGDSEVTGSASERTAPGSTESRRGEWRTVPLIDYDLVGDTSLDLEFAYCGDNSRVVVEETEESVTIRAETSDPKDPPAPDCSALATAVLRSPLGSRPVVDARSGDTIPRRG